MAQTKLTLTFVNLTIDGEILDINLTAGGTALPTFFMEFSTVRATPRQCAIGGSLADTADNYVAAYNADWGYYGSSDGNPTSLAVRVGNSVEITFNDPTWQITSVVGDPITDGDITSSISNEPVETEKTVSLVNFTAYGADPCNYVNVNLACTGGTGLYNLYKDGYTTKLLDSVASPLQISQIRPYTQRYRVTDSADELIGYITVSTPKSLGSKTISISVENFVTGATLTVDADYINEDMSPYDYSIDAGPYQSSNVFTGVLAGTYTINVRDAFGCVTSITNVVVDGVTEVVETVFSLSEINAIRYAKIDSEKKSHKNTLSCFELKQLPYPFYHRYQSSESPLTQFKTNAQYIKVAAVESDGTETAIIPTQLTENIGKTIKTTSTYFDFGEDQSALYFGVVDVLDYVTEAFQYQTDFGFTLPEWANEIGKKVNIEGIGEVTIDNIQYSDFYDSFVAVFNMAYTGAPVSKKVSAVYNVQPYELYEFEADMSTLPASFNILIEVGTDSNNIDFSYISEKVVEFTDSDRYMTIIYYDDENKGGMVYQTDIFHTLHLEGLMDYVGESETEGYNGDQEYWVVDNSVYDSQRFYFPRLTSEMAHKMRLVVAHKYLYINGIPYRLAEAPEISGDIRTNLKTFSVILKRGGEQFLTDEQEIVEYGERASRENAARIAAIEASKGKAMILWTKS